ncbi:hypothetical protein EDB83DRAFT_2384547 [Lactarius deliciosus]|nr:hypothetical protein EDB83DRAFT_2384547 [Lactarius deliciosus]
MSVLLGRLLSTDVIVTSSLSCDSCSGDPCPVRNLCSHRGAPPLHLDTRKSGIWPLGSSHRPAAASDEVGWTVMTWRRHDSSDDLTRRRTTPRIVVDNTVAYSSHYFWASFLSIILIWVQILRGRVVLDGGEEDQVGGRIWNSLLTSIVVPLLPTQT